MEVTMNKKRYVLKNRMRFFGFLFFVFLITFIAVYTAGVSGYTEPVYRTVTIKSGDTLWSIAQQYKDDDCDIREYIYNVKKLNNIDSSILIADTSILIPVKK